MDTLGHLAPPPDPGFDALVAQALALLPAHAPEWTNHNASDPGITLIELLAYFTDLLQYRLGRVGTASGIEFLRLLRGGDLGSLAGVVRPGAAAVREAIDRTLGDLAQGDCAITAPDHERIAAEAIAALPWGPATRLHCLAQTDLERVAGGGEDVEAGQHPGHASLVVHAPADCPPHAQAALRAAVQHALAARRLLTHRLHVLAPIPVFLGVRLWASAAPGADRDALARRIAGSLEGWQPGSAADGAPSTLALAEIADRAAGVEQVDGVDGVALLQAAVHPAGLHDDDAAIGLQIGLHSTVGRDARLGSPPPLSHGRLVCNGDGELTAIRLRAWEAPRLVLRATDIVWGAAPAARHGSPR